MEVGNHSNTYLTLQPTENYDCAWQLQKPCLFNWYLDGAFQLRKIPTFSLYLKPESVRWGIAFSSLYSEVNYYIRLVLPDVTIHEHCTEDVKHIFPVMKLCGLVPNFYVYVPGSNLYITMIGLIWNLCFPTILP
jgi:hypothetical protein